ncbi:MerR family transcriptional regulator [Pseudonocardia sp. TRM90224]|uniref:MerR family transcriptional regulator n=1 Tax=Pseudonocardia sp. TRM90224 TaxID=2812678 RepID=UPI0027DFBF1D|nr:MerR family transcriptional regulator [Pseudonocardia sp. TRM90224]
MTDMRIGELARRTGTTTRALRYYEEQGLLHSARAANGYRDYAPEAETQVANIRMLLAAGLTSDDIRSVSGCLAHDLAGEPACAEAVELYARRLDAVEDRVAALLHVRGRLRAELRRLQDADQTSASARTGASTASAT